MALDGKTGKLCAGFGAGGSSGSDARSGFRPEIFAAITKSHRRPQWSGDVVITGSSIGDNSAVDMPTRSGARLRYTNRGDCCGLGIRFPGQSQQSENRRGQCLVHLCGRSRKRPGVHPYRQRQPGLLWRRAAGRQSLGQFGGRAEGFDGRVCMGISGGAPRSVGLTMSPREPTLIELRGRPAVAVTTKIGNVFVLDRQTGKPLIPSRSAPCPRATSPARTPRPSQPIPAWSAMVPQKLTAADVWGPTPEMRKWCQEKFALLSQ